jgi:hypothetical protein
MLRLIKPAAKAAVAAAILSSATAFVSAETCTTQSQMSPADRQTLSSVAGNLGSRMQSADAAGIRSLSVAEVAADFAGISDAVANIAPKLKGATLTVDQVYLLDASNLKRAADGSLPDSGFYCTLNKTSAEVNFLVPGLPPGKYAFAIVTASGVTAPWRLPFLLRQEQGKWLMAGLYPKPTTAAGHDGLWYWTQARQMVTAKEAWSAWLYFQEAEYLLQPAGFVQTSHLDKLRNEASSGAPPTLSDGVTADAPLVVKSKDGTEYRFTSLGTDDSLNTPSLDIAVHLKADPITDQSVARKRNIAAMSALLGAYPELRKPFHGVWVFADIANQNPYATEQAMSDIP